MSSAFLDVLHADPWSEELIDLPGLNAAAGQAIEARVREAREHARAEPRALRSSSIVVLGPPGAGKTHLFSRLRRHLGPRAVFVHVRPLVHAPMTPRFVLGEVVKQLGYATQGLVQLDALVGSLLAHLSGAATSFPSTFLSEYQQLEQAERDAGIEDAIEKVLGIWQETDESYLRRLLQAPFAKGATQRATLAWLSGRDCDVAQLARIGATASLSEELALPALRTLCSVAALGAPIVLVLDQLENLIEGAEPGERLLGYGNLAAELVDVLRGLVLVHMALDSEWARAIEPSFNLSQRSRVVMERVTLALPTAQEREDLLRLFVDKLPERPAAYPWPFSEARLSRVLSAPGLTPRMLLVECRKALDGDEEEAEEERRGLPEGEGGGGPGAPEARPEAHAASRGLTEEWETCLGSARQVLEEANEQRACVDAARLADGLLACGYFVEGARIAPGLSGQAAQLVVEGEAGRRLLAILSHGHPKSLGATLAKLKTLAARIPVVVVRERARDLPPTWKDTVAKRAELLATGNAEWLWVEADDVVRLLALDLLLQSARSGDVTNEHGEPVDLDAVLAWARSALEVAAWGVVKALLRRPDEYDVQAEEEPLPLVTRAEAHDAPRGPAAPNGVAVAVVLQLRIASLDRVVREAARIQPGSTRASVLAELEASPAVRFFGRNIVCARAET